MIELPDRLDELFKDYYRGDETAGWFREHLIDDAQTRVVTQTLETVHQRAKSSFSIIGIVSAALTYRASELVSGVDSAADIPGIPAGSIHAEIIDGHRTRAAMREHCESPEGKSGAATLNMAIRWNAGKESYQWTRKTVREENPYGGHADEIERAERRILREHENGTWKETRRRYLDW